MEPTRSTNDPLPSASKHRASRIPLTYYRRADGIERGKVWLTAAAVVVVGGWATWGLFGDSRIESPGPVAGVHTMWDSQCNACHQAFTPTGADAVSMFGGPSRHAAITCQQCHLGPAHHANLKGEEAGCASCHREHRGVAASLTHVADGNCTGCHGNLTAHLAKPVQAAEHITSFIDGHPKFRSLPKEDPGRLKFSHRRHLMPGQKLLPDGKETPKRLADLSESSREGYAKYAAADGLLTLDCAACHQPGDGGMMRPVDFGQHCAACHSLKYAPVAEHAAVLDTVPHGLTKDDLARTVRAAIVDRYLAGRSEPAPAKLEYPGKAPRAEAAEIASAIAENQPGAARMLRARCVQCHELSGGETATPLDSPIVPTAVPHVWLRGAKFDHAVHRAVTCIGCHAEAETKWKPGDATALDDQLVMIPNYDTCVKCHTPRLPNGAAGARTDCVECHRYHGSDKPAGTAHAAFKPPTTNDEWDLSRWLKSK